MAYLLVFEMDELDDPETESVVVYLLGSVDTREKALEGFEFLENNFFVKLYTGSGIAPGQFKGNVCFVAPTTLDYTENVDKVITNGFHYLMMFEYDPLTTDIKGIMESRKNNARYEIAPFSDKYEAISTLERALYP